MMFFLFVCHFSRQKGVCHTRESEEKGRIAIWVCDSFQRFLILTNMFGKCLGGCLCSVFLSKDEMCQQ